MGKIDIMRRHRSIQQVRINCDPEEILTGLGIDAKRQRRELVALCPNPSHPDQHVGSWSMRCEPGSDMNGLSYCYACGWSGDVFSLVSLVRGCSFTESVDHVKGVASDAELGEHAADVIYADEAYDREFMSWLPQEMKRPDEVGPIKKGGACWEYLVGRGFGEDEVLYYGLGDMQDSLRMFVPIMFGGKLIGYVARTYVDAEKKVKFPRGGASGTWGLIGLDRADRSRKIGSLVDGWADAFRLRQAGVQNPIAACGSSLTAEQAWALSWLEQIDVWADGDLGGERLIRETVGWLGCGRMIRVAMMAPGTDPANKTPDTIRDIEPVAYSDYRKRRRLNDG